MTVILKCILMSNMQLTYTYTKHLNNKTLYIRIAKGVTEISKMQYNLMEE
jgi:hypothetical protein